MRPAARTIRERGMLLLACLAFLLFAIPRLSFRLDSIPVYLIDLVAALVLLVATFASRRGKLPPNPFKAIVLLMIVLVIVGEVNGALKGGSALASAYLLARTLLALGMFFAIPQLLRRTEDFLPMLKAMAAAILVTSLLMIATSLPQTRPFAIELFFSSSFLEPASERTTNMFLIEATADRGVRGRTLVGVSILGATFINVAYPFVVALFLQRRSLNRHWKFVVSAAIFFGPVAVLMSYSRGPIIGFILVALAALVLNRKRFARTIIVNVSIIALAIMAIGVNSQIFFFDRLENRTQAMLGDSFEDKRESERVYAYSEPFNHLSENIEFLVFGEGTGIIKSEAAEVAGRANHALLAAAYYAYGMIAAVLYHVLIVMGLLIAYRARSYRAPGPARMLVEASFLSMVAVLPWAAFAHSIVDEPRGAMLFFLALGLVVATRNAALAARPQVARRPRQGEATLGAFLARDGGEAR